jgi:ribosomal protein L11 methylase PrmA
MDCKNFFDVGKSDKFRMNDFSFENIRVTDRKQAFNPSLIDGCVVKDVVITLPSIINKVEGNFDVVVANINRNILLADMPKFREKMAPHAILILSGFYTEDVPLLVEKANTLGLTLQQQKEDQNWCCLVFS